MEETGTSIHDEVRLSPSIAKILLEKTPMHAFSKHSKLGAAKWTTSPSMMKGKAVDRLVFGVGPALYISKGKKDPELVCQATDGHEDQEIITVSDAPYREACDIAVQALSGMHDRGIIITPDKAQRKWYWNSLGNVGCKLILDLWDGNRTIYDLKTATSLDDDDIRYAIEKYGYDIQAAATLEACTAITGEKHPVFKFMFVETGDVNDFRLIEMDSRQIGYGTQRWLEAVTIWKKCMETGKWPGRPDAVLGPSRYRDAAQGKLFADQIGVETD